MASLLALLRQQNQAHVAQELLAMTRERPRKSYRPHQGPETYTPSWMGRRDTSSPGILAAYRHLLPSLSRDDQQALARQLTNALTAHNRAITHAYQDPDLHPEDHLALQVQQTMTSSVLMDPITFNQTYQGNRIHRNILTTLSAEDPDPQVWHKQARALGAADLQAQFSRRLMHNTAQGSKPCTWEQTQHTQVKAGARFLNLLWSCNPDAVQEIAASASLEQDYPPNVNLFLEETGIQIFQAFQEVAASTTEAAAFHLANAIATVLSLEAILAGHQNAREMTRRLGTRHDGHSPYSADRATWEVSSSLVNNDQTNCRYACHTLWNNTRHLRKSAAGWSPPLPVDHVIP
jgi:hypothetical protein